MNFDLAPQANVLVPANVQRKLDNLYGTDNHDFLNVKSQECEDEPIVLSRKYEKDEVVFRKTAKFMTSAEN